MSMALIVGNTAPREITYLDITSSSWGLSRDGGLLPVTGLYDYLNFLGFLSLPLYKTLRFFRDSLLGTLGF